MDNRVLPKKKVQWYVLLNIVLLSETDRKISLLAVNGISNSMSRLKFGINFDNSRHVQQYWHVATALCADCTLFFIPNINVYNDKDSVTCLRFTWCTGQVVLILLFPMVLHLCAASSKSKSLSSNPSMLILGKQSKVRSYFQPVP